MDLEDEFISHVPPLLEATVFCLMTSPTIERKYFAAYNTSLYLRVSHSLMHAAGVRLLYFFLLGGKRFVDVFHGMASEILDKISANRRDAKSVPGYQDYLLQARACVAAKWSVLEPLSSSQQPSLGGKSTGNDDDDEDCVLQFEEHSD
jgi:hypothetical protein